MENNRQLKRIVLQAVKIAVGSSIAIYIAEFFNLQFAASAGSIALLTLVTTKWGTVKLSIARLVTFAMSAAMAWIIFSHIKNEWMVYGIFIFLLVVISEVLGWKATISVNAVIGTHFLTVKEITPEFIINELYLVLLGISIALVLNLFYDYRSQERHLIKSMRYTEKRLQQILTDLAAYLTGKEMPGNVWDEIRSMEKELKSFIVDACEYQDNTFHSHPGYYIDYFEMRMIQLGILHNLHYEINKIRTVQKQAETVARFMLYMAEYIIEVNTPVQQLEKLRQTLDYMHNEPLPVSREEFESRAMLYHILMDLEDFLKLKKRFVEALDDEKRRLYWDKNKEQVREQKPVTTEKSQ